MIDNRRARIAAIRRDADNSEAAAAEHWDLDIANMLRYHAHRLRQQADEEERELDKE